MAICKEQFYNDQQVKSIREQAQVLAVALQLQSSDGTAQPRNVDAPRAIRILGRLSVAQWPLDGGLRAR
jgi:hypothetical protein